jgi:hypothetical protein
LLIHVYEIMLTTNKFSKYILTILGLIFIYNTFGYMVLYAPVIQLLKESAESYVTEKEIDSDELITFKFQLTDIENNKFDFRWIDKNEFNFNGLLYDVKNKSVKNDSLTLVCHLDENENIVAEVFSMLLKHNKREASNDPINITFMFGLYLDSYDNYAKVDNAIKNDITFSKNERVHLNFLKDIPTPPPRLLSLSKIAS